MFKMPKIYAMNIESTVNTIRKKLGAERFTFQAGFILKGTHFGDVFLANIISAPKGRHLGGVFCGVSTIRADTETHTILSRNSQST